MTLGRGPVLLALSACNGAQLVTNDAVEGDLGDDTPRDSVPADSEQSGSDSAEDSASDSGGSGDVDDDLDGLPDADEALLAAEYLPFLSLDESDGCPRMGILFRLRPHPDDPTKLHILYDMLYESDCGLGGHVGDDEVFALTVDPSLPAPDGILAMVAIAHQDTACEAVTTCGCDSDPCETTGWNGADWPVVYASLGKHGNYLTEGACDGACVLTNWCTLAATPPSPVLVNAGEPEAPLTRNLTEAGLITAELGWTEPDLFDFDPWGGTDFGSAGNVTDDLTDPAFDTPACE